MNSESKSVRTRNRILICVSIVAGSIAAALFWNAAHQTPPFAVTDEQARKEGFSSAQGVEDFDEANKKILDDESRRSGWDEADFRFLAKTFDSNNETAIFTVVVNLGWLSRPDQRRRAMELMGGRRIPQDERKAWLYVVREWSQGRGDPSIVSYLLASSNPDVVSIAKEATHVETSNTNPGPR